MSDQGYNVYFALDPSQKSTMQQQMKTVGETITHYIITKIQEPFPTITTQQVGKGIRAEKEGVLKKGLRMFDGKEEN